MDPANQFCKDQCLEKVIDAPYQEACGGMLWPAFITQVDIQLVVGVISQFTQNLAHEHWEAIKRVISYLHTTKDLWLTLGGVGTCLQVFSDADWVSQPDRHSISGFVARLGCSTVTWSSKCQVLVVQSSTEAEYIATAHVAQEICWLRSFLNELGVQEPGPTTLLLDNQSTIAIVKNNKFHMHTKHINI